MSVTSADRRIRSLRPPKPPVDAFTAHGSLIEEERRPNGEHERALTIFLAGAECPYTCSFCDLWRYTIDGPTPVGALASQVEKTLTAVDRPLPHRIKLYNASNFFDRRAVPLEDRARLVDLTREFGAVTVESHARTVGPQTLAFARAISGRLEVAMGLETIHPVAASQLNKRLELTHFDAAAAFLAEAGIDLRVFVLLGTPHVSSAESVAWTIRTVEYAVGRGASVVSIIPVRGGNGEMERLRASGEFVPPTLAQLEDALAGCLGNSSTVVTADLWDVEKMPGCSHCRAARVARLARINLSGNPEPRVDCPHCGAA